MRRVFTLLLALSCALALTACSKPAEENDTPPDETERVTAVQPVLTAFENATHFEEVFGYAPPAKEQVSGYPMNQLPEVAGHEELDINGWHILAPAEGAVVNNYVGSYDETTIPVSSYVQGTEGEEGYKYALLMLTTTSDVETSEEWLNSAVYCVELLGEQEVIVHDHQKLRTFTGNGAVGVLAEQWSEPNDYGVLYHNLEYHVYAWSSMNRQFIRGTITLRDTAIPSDTYDAEHNRAVLLDDLRDFAELYGISYPLDAIIDEGVPSPLYPDH